MFYIRWLDSLGLNTFQNRMLLIDKITCTYV